jgi:formylglycine-generating enzyme required for sulfatase activity
VVSKVQVAQRPGTHKVDIHYDVADADGDALWITVKVSDNGGASYVLPAAGFSGDNGFRIKPGSGKHIVWDAGVDWGGKYSANMRFRVTADDTLPQNMVWIAPGTFTRDGSKVTISRGFGMSKYEVTQAQSGRTVARGV